MQTQDQQSQPLGNSLGFVLDRSFSLSMFPANSSVRHNMADTLPTNDSSNIHKSSATYMPQQQQIPMFPTHQLSRRMSLPVSFMHQPSMTEMLHGLPPLNNTSSTAILDPFTMYAGHRGSTDDLNLVLPSDFKSLQQQFYTTPCTTRATTPSSTFDNAFNELIFERPMNSFELQQAKASVPQFEFSFFKHQQILQQQQQFQQQGEQQQEHRQFQQRSPKPAKSPQLETIHESTPQSLLPMPEFYNTNHNAGEGEWSSLTSPQQVHVSPPASVLERVKQADFAKSPQKFKPTESQLSTLIGVFEKNPFPSATLRNHLADMLDIQPKQVRFWFQNRRATYKINGVYVIKPKRSKSGEIVTMGIESGPNEPTLAPISESQYFFVEAGRRGSF
ncbi:UNVERIFIED_CONTAM: hypothetical protein HDU68_007337 [Siphonaria sp. JEL0065]|nr:hypothetical protein HDU68_007337 [Siphonaria sp. JEL0065]